jgi:hypothetical protein
MVHVVGFVEDECCFNFVSFLKNKMRNHLNIHLQMVVAMYAHKLFTFDTFSYEIVYDMWLDVQTGNYKGQYA